MAVTVINPPFVLVLCFIVQLSLSSYGQAMIVFEGAYQGKNVYVQNPSAADGSGSCVHEVRVNDNATHAEISSSTFEIDLRPYNFKLGDVVSINIFHKDGCKPRLLNPEALRAKSMYEMVEMHVTPDEVLTWVTKGEKGKLTFVIEQYRWNKWVKIGEVDGVGTSGNNTYTFKVMPHSGENKFRVKQTDYTNQPRISNPVVFTSNRREVTFSPAQADREILFNGGETLYEIFDQYGTVVKKGSGGRIDISSLPKGAYLLNYDNRQGQFFKR